MTTPGSLILRWARGLRFPKLVALVGGLLLLNLVIPDPFPWFDEVLLGLISLLLASFRKRRQGSGDDNPTGKGNGDGSVIDVAAEEVERD